MLGDLGPAAFQTMTAVQQKVSDVLNRVNRERTPLDLTVMAVARALRELLRMVPPDGRQMMTGLVIAFLSDEKAETEDKLIHLM